jgi:glycolate dehydrogenase FAD-linked subunit
LALSCAGLHTTVRGVLKMKEKAVKEFIDDLKNALKTHQILTDLPSRIAYRIAHGPEALMHSDLGEFTPAAVLKPKTTEDVVKAVKCCDAYNIPIVPQGGRTGSFGAEAMKDCLVIDLTDMNKILKFDEGNYRIKAQTGIRIKDYNEFIEEKGYMSLEYPTMSWTATLGSRVGVSGYNKFENTWGGSATNIKGIEVVLANGDVVNLGKGSRIPSKNVTGFDLMSMFFGSKGTFGIVTAVTEQFIDIPSKYIYGIWAFKSIEDATGAYIELLSSKYSGAMWRSKTYHKLRVGEMMDVMEGRKWPDDVEMLTDYNIYGEPEIAESMEKICIDIIKKHNGFWRDDIPNPADITQKHHDAMGKYVGMGSLHSDRIIDGGMGFKLIPLDPIVPNSRLVDAYKGIFEHLKKIEDGKSYPALTGKLFLFDPGAAVPGDMGYTKLFIVLNADSKKWDNETRHAFKEWFKDYTHIVWSFNAALTGTHGFIPGDIQEEIVKAEIGENEYKLMKQLKNLLDPNNIMNPKIR